MGVLPVGSVLAQAVARIGVVGPTCARRQSVRRITLAAQLENRAVVGQAVQVRPRVSGSLSSLLSSRSLVYTGGRVPEPKP